MREVQLRLLGPMELRVSGCAVRLGPARQRTVLAALAVDAGQSVPLDVLIGRVWDDDPPGGVRSGLYSYVTRLRRALSVAGDQVGLHSRTGGYVLEVDPECVDLVRFRRLAQAAVPGSAEADLGALERALDLWRGPALADLSGGWVSRTRERLEQQRVDVVLGWAQALLAAGRPGEVIGTLRDLVALHPLVEPLAARLIDALYRDGRAAEALNCYANVRRHLIEELGAEPGAELRELHRAVLRGDQRRPAEAPRVASRPTGALPADTGTFTGRAREIEQITAAAAHRRVLVIHAIGGMPGIGKTALAVHVAHRLGAQFPDGHVFVDLHGHTEGRSPAEAGEVLATLLTADGVDPRQLPAATDARSTLWRERLAGRRMLVVLDNAADSAQVSPLLPASAGCLVLVTSRRFLGDLPSGAVPVSLDVLAADEAEQMFLRLAPRAGSHPEQVADLVAACGFLPLAISLLARVLSRHRGWTIGDLLTETRTRLLDVTAEHASVAAAFGLSYHHLPGVRQRFFRYLALHPGTEIEPYAAAALAGVRVGEASEQLDALHRDSLLIEVGYHRYTMHDLIRSYAGTLTAGDPPQERDRALDRLLNFYQCTARTAEARLTRLTRPANAGPAPADVADAPDLASPDQALSWVRAERANLLACLASTNEPRRIIALTAGMIELLRRDGPWTVALALHAGAVRAAAAVADKLEHANALRDLATVRRLSGDYAGAEKDIRLALDLYRVLGNRLGEANALTDLAKALSRTADYLKAATVVRQALDLYRYLRDMPGEAGALVELAVARGMTSDFLGAQQLLRRALKLYRQLGDQPGQAYTLRILGIAHGRTGDYPGALELLGMSLELYRRLGGRRGQALALNDLGQVTARTGDFPTAAHTLRMALGLHREIDHRVGQSTALLYLGCVLRRAGDLAGAAEALEEALALDRDIRNRSGEAMTLNELGAVHRLVGDPDRATACHQEALELAALVPSPFDEAQAVAGFGRCAIARGRYDEGAAQLRQALDILQKIGAAEAAEVAAELDGLARPS